MFDDVSFYIHMENKRCYKCLAIVGYFDNVTGLGKGSWIYVLKHMAHPTHLAIMYTTFVRETIVKTLNYHISEKLVTKVHYSSIIIAHENEF